jgi:hypothetical protein
MVSMLHTPKSEAFLGWCSIHWRGIQIRAIEKIKFSIFLTDSSSSQHNGQQKDLTPDVLLRTVLQIVDNIRC